MFSATYMYMLIQNHKVRSTIESIKLKLTVTNMNYATFIKNASKQKTFIFSFQRLL